MKPPVERVDLLKAMADIISLSDEKKKILEREFRPFRCEKGKILLFDGDTEGYLRYIETGVCRVYVVDKEGIDHSIDFIFPGQWATGFASFIHQKQNNQYIETLTDISGRRISFSQLEKLYNSSDDFNYIGRRFVEEVTVALSERIHSFVTASPIERYERILDKNPELIKKRLN
jgi:CRP-like cAMP-binding protein